MRDPLDLGFFACREINVSFAAIGIGGLSDFSPTVEIAVHGGEIMYMCRRVYVQYSYSFQYTVHIRYKSLGVVIMTPYC